MRERNYKRVIFRSRVLAITIILIATSFTAISITGQKENTDFLKYTFSFDRPHLKEIETMDEQFTSVYMPGTISTGLKVGNPVVQIKPISLLIPQGKDVNDVTVFYKSIVKLRTQRMGIDLEKNPIFPYQKPIPIGDKEISNELEKNNKIYEIDRNYPGILFDNVDVSFSRGYSILTLNLYPIQYNPKSGDLFYYDEMIVNIELKESRSLNPYFRDNPEDDSWVKGLVSNSEVVRSYEDNGFDELDYPGGLCDSSDHYDYVIITTEQNNLDYWETDSSKPYNWDSLMNKHETENGLSCTLVTMEDIIAESDYWNSDPLFNDSAANIREFCRDAYEDWGTSYILIGGDDEWIPAREMDYGYESNVDSDIYWNHLDNSFNADGDEKWGEAGDGGFDLYSELYIGRLTCDVPQDVSNWMTKSFYYSDSVDKDYLENAAFFGGDLDQPPYSYWDTEGDDFIDYSAIKGTNNWLGPNPNSDGPYPGFLGFQYGFETWNEVNPGLEYNLSVKWTGEGDTSGDDGPNPGGWQGGSTSTAVNGLKNAINNDHVTLISAIAHANSDMSMDVQASTWESDYHNTKPFFLHDYGCHCGDMDASDDGVLHSMLFHSDTELAFGCVYHTGYGWGNLDSTNSSSALQQKSFWDYLFDVTNNSGSTMNWQLGKAQAWSKDLMAPTINWDSGTGTWRGTIQSCLLFADPAQLIKPPMQAEHNVGVQEIDVDSHVTPDQTTTVDSTIVNSGENDESNIVVSFRVDGTELDSQTIPFMASQTTEQVSFDWTPTTGLYTLTINATIAGVTEDYYFDNEKSKLVIVGPDVAVSNLNTPQYAGIGETTPISAIVENLGTTSETITVDLIVDGNTEDIKTITLDNETNQQVTFDWIPSIEGTYPVGISAEISGSEPYTDNNEQTNDVNVFISKGNILLVDDDDGGSYETYFENAIFSNNYLYDVWDRNSQGSPTSDNMDDYDAVVWFTGDDYTGTLNSEDQTNLANYLDNGGRLFITGQDIGYEIHDDSFYSDYLHAEYNNDDTNIFTLEGTNGDPIGDGLTIGISSGDGADNQNYPDGITPIGLADTVFSYESSSDDGGIKADTGTYREVYFSFGFEAINNQNDRNTVMDRVLSWLIGSTGPTLSYSPESYDFGSIDEGDTDSTTFEIWNSGAEILNYTLSTTETWIDIIPTNGSSQGETDTITLTIDTTGLSVGQHIGEVTISSNGGSGTFTVTVYVNAQGTEILDVEQTIYNRGFPIRYALDGTWGGAQSFTPTVTTMTRAEIYLRKFGTPTFDLTIEIREDSPTGILLDTQVFTPSEVDSSWSWLNIDFTDIIVTTGTQYFIVIPPPTTNPGNSFGYEWGYAFGNQYGNGAFWFTRDGGTLWRDLPNTYEFTFKTYGINDGLLNSHPTGENSKLEFTENTLGKKIANIIDEGFENGFPPNGWTNTGGGGWLDSEYGYAHSGKHWAFSWETGNILKTYTCNLADNSELHFCYAAEKSDHPMDLEIYIDGTNLVYSIIGNVETEYQEAVVDLSSYTGAHTISFVALTDDYYGQMLDDILLSTSYEEVLDIDQSLFDRPFIVRHASDGDWSGAQNFKPTVNTITKVELYLKSYGSVEFDLTVELRKDSVDGALLDSKTFTPPEVPDSWTWFEIDFNDVNVESDTDYFIVISPPPDGVTTTFGYGWGYALGNYYNDGSLWFTRTGGNWWLDLPNKYDFTFRTYGLI